jgi:predicted  nucleic acid-binding Zn-ribbon protein
MERTSLVQYKRYIKNKNIIRLTDNLIIMPWKRDIGFGPELPAFNDYTDTRDVELKFGSHEKKISYLSQENIKKNQEIKDLNSKINNLEDIIEKLITRLEDLENIVHYGPNSRAMDEAKKDFESHFD